MNLQNLPNLFPYFERNENPKYVRLGVVYSILYAVFLLVIVVLWAVVLVLPDATVTYDPHTYPVDYQPGEELKEPIPLEKIHSLFNDKAIREVRCMCTNEDPAFGDFATIVTKQYKFCTNIIAKFNFERCKSFESVQAATEAGMLCPNGLTMDEFNFDSEFLRKETQAAYTLDHFRELCLTSHKLLDGLKSGILAETISSTTWIKSERLRQILRAKLGAAFKMWIPMMYASMQHSFGFGRFNTPFAVMQLNSAKTAFTDLRTNNRTFYAVPTPNKVFGTDPSEDYSLYYEGGDKYYDFMTKDFSKLKVYAQQEKESSSGMWKVFWAYLYELSENTQGYDNFGAAQANFFIQEKRSAINETAYHAACRPSHCQYLRKTKINLWVIIGVIVGVAGTISEILRLLCEKLAHRQIEIDLKQQSQLVNTKYTGSTLNGKAIELQMR